MTNQTTQIIEIYQQPIEVVERYIGLVNLTAPTGGTTGSLPLIQYFYQASDRWVWPHGLGRYLSISVWTLGGRGIVASPLQPTQNEVIVQFGFEQNGFLIGY